MAAISGGRCSAGFCVRLLSHHPDDRRHGAADAVLAGPAALGSDAHLGLSAPGQVYQHLLEDAQQRAAAQRGLSAENPCGAGGQFDSGAAVSVLSAALYHGGNPVDCGVVCRGHLDQPEAPAKAHGQDDPGHRGKRR